MPRAVMIILAFATLLCGGCGQGLFADAQEDYVKPTIAVMKFENRARSRWAGTRATAG